VTRVRAGRSTGPNAGRSAALACLLPALWLSAAVSTAPVAAQTQTSMPTKVPWAVGENLEYTVRIIGIRAGTGFMTVAAIDTMRGRDAWRLHLNIKGSALLGAYHVDDTYNSWMDVESLNSLRFEQDLYEGGKRTVRKYDIFPDRGMMHQEGKDERKSVADPLDDASLFFFARTLPLEVGHVYRFDRYFDPNANPVVIKVLRKDTIDVPAGRFPAIVLRPSFKTNGLFAENGNAEIWLSDDEHRILLQMNTHFSFIKLGLQLTKLSYGTPAPVPSPDKMR
jgi:hypothetical protein